MTNDKRPDNPNENSGYFFFKAKGGKWESINPDDIQYIHANGNCTDIVMRDGKQTITSRLGIIMKQITDPRFVQVHRSCYVNMDKLKSFAGRIILIGDEEIVIGDTYLESFKSHLKLIK